MCRSVVRGSSRRKPICAITCTIYSQALSSELVVSYGLWVLSRSCPAALAATTGLLRRGNSYQGPLDTQSSNTRLITHNSKLTADEGSACSQRQLVRRRRDN